MSVLNEGRERPRSCVPAAIILAIIGIPWWIGLVVISSWVWRWVL